MTDVPIIIARTGAITAASKRKMEKAGVAIIEADDPASVRYITASHEVSHGDMLFAAMKALTTAPTTTTSHNFLLELVDAMQRRREEAQTP